jgi:hypothetical protein
MKCTLVLLTCFLPSIFLPFWAHSEPIPETAEKCVAYITIQNGSDKTPIGTGFFVGYKCSSVPDKYYVGMGTLLVF